MESVQKVFESRDLRKLIIKNVIEEECRQELEEKIADMVIEEIVKKWCFHCKCASCQAAARAQIEGD